jgi:rubrerythrin
MTNEEAIKILDTIPLIDDEGLVKPDWVIVIDMAIKALEQQPCEDWRFYYNHGYAQAKRDLLCDDCISREETLKYSHIEYDDDGVGHKVIYAEDIEELPSVTPQPKVGRWIRQTDDYYDYYECEQCGIAVGLDDIKNYCPNCGCRMKGEGE